MKTMSAGVRAALGGIAAVLLAGCTTCPVPEQVRKDVGFREVPGPAAAPAPKAP